MMKNTSFLIGVTLSLGILVGCGNKKDAVISGDNNPSLREKVTESDSKKILNDNGNDLIRKMQEAKSNFETIDSKFTLEPKVFFEDNIPKSVLDVDAMGDEVEKSPQNAYDAHLKGKTFVWDGSAWTESDNASNNVKFVYDNIDDKEVVATGSVKFEEIKKLANYNSWGTYVDATEFPLSSNVGITVGGINVGDLGHEITLGADGAITKIEQYSRYDEYDQTITITGNIIGTYSEEGNDMIVDVENSVIDAYKTVIELYGYTISLEANSKNGKMNFLWNDDSNKVSLDNVAVNNVVFEVKDISGILMKVTGAAGLKQFEIFSSYIYEYNSTTLPTPEGTNESQSGNFFDWESSYSSVWGNGYSYPSQSFYVAQEDFSHKVVPTGKISGSVRILGIEAVYSVDVEGLYNASKGKTDREIVKMLNDYADMYVYEVSSNQILATLSMDVVNNSYGGEDYMLMLNFSDKTKVDPEVYFGDGFEGLQQELEDIANEIANMGETFIEKN